MIPPNSTRSGRNSSDFVDVDRHLLADGTGHERQALVVGEGALALVCAGFLEQVGLDPVVAGVADRREHSRSPLTTIWRPGLELLERIGLRRPLDRAGTALVCLHSLDGEATWSVEPSSRPGLVAIPTDRFERLLTRQLGRRIRRTDRSVSALESVDSAVNARFDGGVEETFDVAITTTGVPLGGPGDRVDEGVLRTWMFRGSQGLLPANTVAAGWDTDRAAVLTGLSDRTYVRLLSTTQTLAAPVDATALAERFGNLVDPLGDPFADLDPSEINFHRPRRHVPLARYNGRVAVVGPRTRASTPGDTLGTALGIEDAWVLADSLAYGPRSVATALEQYQARRRERDSAIQAELGSIERPESLGGPLTGPLRRLRAARRLSFSYLVDGAVHPLAIDVPERL